MLIYSVTYELNGETRTENFEGASFGHAFQKCVKDHPGAKLIGGEIDRKLAGGYLYMKCDPPSQVKIEPEGEPQPKPKQAEMLLGDPRKEKIRSGRKK